MVLHWALSHALALRFCRVCNHIVASARSPWAPSETLNHSQIAGFGVPKCERGLSTYQQPGSKSQLPKGNPHHTVSPLYMDV